MLAKIWEWLGDLERKTRRSFGTDISTPSKRFWSKVHYHLFDHAFLRTIWTNFWPLAPGVWRSNQPTHRRLAKYAQMGVKTVVNLRGEDRFAHYLFEKESCDALGLTLVNRKLWARSAAPRENIVAVIDALREAEKPLILHCKSGADRAGFVSAMYLMVFEDVPVETAMKQLSFKYIHLKHTKTGLQGYILRVYQARLALGEISFEDWIRQEYIPGILQTGWDTRRVERETAQELMTKALG